MNRSTSNKCDQFNPVRLLDETGSDAQILSMTAHLETCPNCQEKLLRVAGGPSWIKTIQSHHQVSRSSDSCAEAGRTMDADHQTSMAPTSTQHGNHPSQEELSDDLLRFLHPTDDPQSLGRIGPYEVTGVVGQGGMGIVLKARDPALGRFVAVKVLHPILAADGTARQRFASEAKAAATVTHDNVIPVHSVDMQGDLPYFVMPLIRGESLEQRLYQSGPFDLAEILRVATQIASGLSAAHAQGLIHRDIKPANVLLDAGTQRLTITDFGLARAIDDVASTRPGVIAGTPQFMSPEQTTGKPIDERSDLFSLGSVIYTLATGRPPFRGDNSHTVMDRLVHDSPTPIRQSRPEFPEWLDRFVGGLMAKDPEQRPRNAAEVERIAQACLAHVQHSGRSLPQELKQPWKVSVPVWILAGLVATLVFSIALAVRFDWRGQVNDSSSTDTGLVEPFPITPVREQAPFDWGSDWSAPFDSLEDEMIRFEREMQP